MSWGHAGITTRMWYGYFFTEAKMHLKLRAQAKKQIETIDANIDKLHTLRNSIESAQYVRHACCSCRCAESCFVVQNEP